MFTVETHGTSVTIVRSEGLFSPQQYDAGTGAMLSCVEFSPEDKVLDLGCGYGIVGIIAAKILDEDRVTMTDIDASAVSASRYNALHNGFSQINCFQSDGFTDIRETGFTKILSNPPYHTDFRVAKHFIEKGFNRLVIGGRMFMVTKRKDWYKNKFISVFGGVKICESDGYFVFIAEKRSSSYAK